MLMPKYTLEVDASASSLTVIADIHINTRTNPLPPPLYDDIEARPTQPREIRLAAGDYLMAFDVQNGSGAFTLRIVDASGVPVASQKFTAPPQVGRFWYFTVA
jgi:hypothetical protein